MWNNPFHVMSTYEQIQNARKAGVIQAAPKDVQLFSSNTFDSSINDVSADSYLTNHESPNLLHSQDDDEYPKSTYFGFKIPNEIPENKVNIFSNANKFDNPFLKANYQFPQPKNHLLKDKSMIFKNDGESNKLSLGSTLSQYSYNLKFKKEKQIKYLENPQHLHYKKSQEEQRKQFIKKRFEEQRKKLMNSYKNQKIFSQSFSQNSFKKKTQIFSNYPQDQKSTTFFNQNQKLYEESDESNSSYGSQQSNYSSDEDEHQYQSDEKIEAFLKDEQDKLKEKGKNTTQIQKEQSKKPQLFSQAKKVETQKKDLLDIFEKPLQQTTYQIPFKTVQTQEKTVSDQTVKIQIQNMKNQEVESLKQRVKQLENLNKQYLSIIESLTLTVKNLSCIQKISMQKSDENKEKQEKKQNIFDIGLSSFLKMNKKPLFDSQQN